MGNFLKNLPYKSGPSKVCATYNKSMKEKYISDLKAIGGMNFVDNIQ